MKPYIYLIIYLSITSLIFGQDNQTKPLYLINKCDEEDCSCIERQWIVSNPSIGLTFFYDIDTNKYKKKQIYFVLEDLKVKYKLLDSKTYNAIDGPATLRNNFKFFFSIMILQC
jgi:hypothetical protein